MAKFYAGLKFVGRGLKKRSEKSYAKKLEKGSKIVYRSCIALFYRKRLPQQQGDIRIGERETSMH